MLTGFILISTCSCDAGGGVGGVFAYWSSAVVHTLPEASRFFIRLISV